MCISLKLLWGSQLLVQDGKFLIGCLNYPQVRVVPLPFAISVLRCRVMRFGVRVFGLRV